MNYKELSYAFKNIISWYKKKTKVLNIKSRPYNTGFVFFDLISRLINDNKKVLYVFSMGSDEIKSKSHDELYMKSIQKIMPGDIENGITFISIDEIENIGEEYSLIIFDDITMFSKSTIKDIRDAIEKVYWKVNKIIIYSCERVFPIGENMDLVYLLNPMPMIEPRFLNTRIKLEDDIPLAVYEYVKWFSYNNKNVIIMVPDEEKLSKVYYTYKNNLKDNNAKVVKYEKGDDFKNIEKLRHPYTKALYKALPNHEFKALDDKTQPLPSELPKGCVFCDRCKIKTKECEVRVPEIKEIRNGKVRCIHAT